MTIRFRGGRILFVEGSGEPLATPLLALAESCCCPLTDGICLVPRQWRIMDESGNIHAQGEIVAGEDFTILDDFPCVYSPSFYWAQEYHLTLEVTDCGNGWSVIDEWDVNITLCDGPGSRYPRHGDALDETRAVSFPPPDDCACKNMEAVKNDGAECDPCPDITASCGTGQMWRNPLPGPAYKFVGTIDGEWTNLLNWQDEDGNSPASELPNFDRNVVIASSVGTNSSSIDHLVDVPFVRNIVIEEGVSMGISFGAKSLTCYGSIDNPECPCPEFSEAECRPCIAVYMAGLTGIEEAGDFVFKGDGSLGGTSTVVLYPIQSDLRVVIFEDNSANSGHVYGKVLFRDSSVNYVYVDGPAFLSGEAENNGSVGGDATFTESSFNSGKVLNNAAFGGNSYNAEGAIIGYSDESACYTSVGYGSGNATFSDESENYGYVNGNGDFFDYAKNYGEVYGDGTFHQYAGQFLAGEKYGLVAGDAIFSDFSVNAGFVDGNAEFNDSSNNEGPPSGSAVGNFGVVRGNAVFNDSSYNWNNGVIEGNAIFNDSSANGRFRGESDYGFVRGDAEFNDSATNGDTVEGNAVFNGAATNGVRVDGNAEFYGTSASLVGSYVGGNATFNDDAKLYGEVAGVATFNDCSYNDGGTAGTFVPNPPPSAYPC